MLIIGAKGFAKELLNILHNNKQLHQLAFYDDLNYDIEKLFEKFPILKNEVEAINHFRNYDDPRFILGIGNPILRCKMYKKFRNLGGVLASCISPFSRIGSYNVQISAGSNILDNATISNDVKIGMGCIIYYNVVITHDCIINDFVEISPSANLLGRCKIGSFTQIGSNATILPDLTVGENVTVGAGAVVTKSVPDNCIVAGVPAVVKRKVPAITF